MIATVFQIYLAHSPKIVDEKSQNRKRSGNTHDITYTDADVQTL